MSRIARIVLENIPYHITQRGNGRQQVFFDPYDYQLYLDLLQSYAEDAELRIWAYCHMPNHVHLIAAPGRPDAMSSALGRTHADYARHFNLKRRTCGHVWQARFFSCPLEAAHLWRAMAYVERNRAGRYEWSSARVHPGRAENPGFIELSAWQEEYTRQRWKQVLEFGVEEEAFGLRLQEASRRGRPLAAGRQLRPCPVGRPNEAAREDSRQIAPKIGI